MKLEARLTFIYDTEHEAKSVNDAISPDNIEVPIGLNVETARDNCLLSTSVSCDKSIETFIATLDDLLACISVAEQVFRAIRYPEIIDQND